MGVNFEKLYFPIVLAFCLSFLGCDKPASLPKEKPVVTAGSNAKKEDAVVYMRSRAPEKFDLDAVFLGSRETVFFKAMGLNPDGLPLVSIAENVESGFDLGIYHDRFDVIVDREKGILCLKEQCIKIYMICPSEKYKKKDEICKYYNQAKG
ncbi:hypothetical protein [Paracidovorax avenae]|uniref:hypothetical protein n=1 Tax=Paracidovorax avenae TaxID=80867 RepID=UPI0012FE4F11|nr:hypothetical protein [Paracidovorax avenae]